MVEHDLETAKTRRWTGTPESNNIMALSLDVMS